MYAIRSYYALPGITKHLLFLMGMVAFRFFNTVSAAVARLAQAIFACKCPFNKSVNHVITSYSIHYTKLYENPVMIISVSASFDICLTCRT